MSKDLEALEEARRYAHMLITSGTWDNKIGPNLDIVEKELKEYKKIKEIIIGEYLDSHNMINYLREQLSNPKNLVDENILLRKLGEQDAYKKIIDLFEDKKSVEKYNEQDFEIAHLKLELANYKKLKKVLEIIKNKKVDVMKLYYSDILVYYNESGIYEELTQEEYDLLKKELKNE